MFDSLRETLAGLLEDPTERLIVVGAFLLCVVAVLIYLAIKLRRRAVGEVAKSSDHLTEFREMFESGKMSEFEYRRVRMRLGESVQREVLGENSDAGMPEPSHAVEQPPGSPEEGGEVPREPGDS